MGYRIGIDAGSKTIKVVVLDEDGAIVHAGLPPAPCRHPHDAGRRAARPGVALRQPAGARLAVTGSAGIALAGLLGLPFVQEVVSTTRAVQAAYPEADAFVELGGEDAKVVYLTGGLRAAHERHVCRRHGRLHRHHRLHDRRAACPT